MIGHLLGAAGGVEFVVCVKSIQDGFIHQTVGTENVDPECDLDYTVERTGRERCKLCSDEFSWVWRTQCDTVVGKNMKGKRCVQ